MFYKCRCRVNNASEPCARSQRSPLMHGVTTAQKGRSNRSRSSKASQCAHMPVDAFVQSSLQRSLAISLSPSQASFLVGIERTSYRRKQRIRYSTSGLPTSCYHGDQLPITPYPYMLTMAPLLGLQRVTMQPCRASDHQACAVERMLSALEPCL